MAGGRFRRFTGTQLLGRLIWGRVLSYLCGVEYIACRTFKVDDFVKGLSLLVGIVVAELQDVYVGKTVRDAAAHPSGSGWALRALAWSGLGSQRSALTASPKSAFCLSVCLRQRQCTVLPSHPVL